MSGRDYYDNLGTDWALLGRKQLFSSGTINKPLHEQKMQSFVNNQKEVFSDNVRYQNIRPVSMDRKKKQKFINFMPQE